MTMTTNTLLQSYQDMPYLGLTFSQMHPNRLAVMATLFGLKPPPVAQCRYLELGCASGSNLLPMAYMLPESEFVGLDFAANQIEMGQAAVNSLNLKNLHLQSKDILDIGPDLGQFDYIVAHGVYSWVPAPVRDKLLAICKQNLKPNGIVYMSYNTYPGWHMYDSLRDLMQYHGRHHTDPQSRLEKAHAAIEFLAKSMPTQQQGYLNFVRAYFQDMRQKPDALLLHDELETVNDPVYFHQFVEHISQHGLQHLTEVQLSNLNPKQLPPAAQKMIPQMITSSLDWEQYTDYLLNRSLRESLLCHDDITIKRSLNPGHLVNFYIASRAKPLSSDFDLNSEAVEHFQSFEGANFASNHPVSKAAMLHLHHIWPQAIHFQELVAIALSMVAPASKNADPRQDAMTLAKGLLEGYIYSNDLIDLFIVPPKPCIEINAHPIASPIARFQATDSTEVTNLYHERIELDAMTCFILSNLDGHSSRSDLLRALSIWIAENNIKIERKGQAINDLSQDSVVLANMLDFYLERLAAEALLVG